MQHVVFVSIMIVSIISVLRSAVWTVAKEGGADFSSIQAAVNKASPGDEIIINDTAVYEEQVTVDSTKNGLYLHSVNPLQRVKPVIRYLDNRNVHPKDSVESRNAATINYDHNGALQVLGAKQVRIDGIEFWRVCASLRKKAR